MVPSIQLVIVATPSASDVTGAGAFPALAVNSTTAPPTGFSNASVTRALRVPVTVSPTRPLSATGVSGTKRVAGPAMPAAVTTSGVTPDTDTVIVFAPARGPSVHAPIDVGELEVRPGAPTIFPPPDEMLTVNFTSPIAAPDASKATNWGAMASVVPAGAVWPSPATRRIPAGLTAGPMESWQAADKTNTPPATTRDVRNNFT